MYQTRENIIIPDNIRSVAMSSAAASRIPIPVKADAVTPITGRRPSIADVVPFSWIRLSSSVKCATSTYPVRAKHQPKSLAINVFTAKGVPASDRIQERRKLVAAKFGLPSFGLPSSKRPRPTSPVVVAAPRKHVKLICHILGRNFRQGDITVPGPVKVFVDFSERVKEMPSRIPSDFSGRRPFTKGGYNLPALIKPVFLPLLPSRERGDQPYCPCHGPPLQGDCHIGPKQWSTTPAEADVDPKRARRVRFAGTASVITPTDDHGRYFRELWWTPKDHAKNGYRSYKSTDRATKEDDERAIALLDSASAIAAAKVSSVNLQAVFDECFPDDDE